MCSTVRRRRIHETPTQKTVTFLHLAPASEDELIQLVGKLARYQPPEAGRPSGEELPSAEVVQPAAREQEILKGLRTSMRSSFAKM